MTNNKEGLFELRELEVKEWLENILSAKLGNTRKQFYGHLKNGLILVRAFNSVFPEMKIEVKEDGPVPYIYSFLSELSDIGIDERDKFKGSDLIDNKNYVKVIYCLRLFAHRVKILKPKYKHQIPIVHNVLDALQNTDFIKDGSFNLNFSCVERYEEIFRSFEEVEPDEQPIYKRFSSILSKMSNMLDKSTTYGNEQFSKIKNSLKSKTDELKESKEVTFQQKLFGFSLGIIMILIFLLWINLWWSNLN